MPSIADIVGQLAAAPKPVICLAAGTTLPAFTDLSTSALVNDLITLSTALLNQAMRSCSWSAKR